MPLFQQRDYRWIALITALLSFAFSAFSLYADDVINNDGVEFLRLAASIQDGEWRHAFQTYKWPFYSSLIAAVSSISGLELEPSALLLNAVFNMMIALAFMAIILELGGDRRTLIAAAAIILLFPALNEYRSFTIRDPGYLAFYLISILFFFKLYRQPGFLLAISSLLAMMIATLFRIEGILFILAAPLLLILRNAQTRGTRWLILGLVLLTVVVIIVGFGWWFFQPTHELGNLHILSNPIDVLKESWAQVTGDLQQKLTHIRSELLGRYSEGYTYAVTVFIVLTIIFTEVATELGFIYFLLLIYTIRKRKIFEQQRMRVIWLALIGINVIILFNFVMLKFFLAPRYSLALLHTAIIPIPFGLVIMYERFKERKRKGRVAWQFPTMIVLLALTGLEGLDEFTEKSHIKVAGQWIHQNTEADDRIYANDKILAFYSRRQATIDDYIDDQAKLSERLFNAWWKNQYVAIRIKRNGNVKEENVTAYFQQQPIKRFAGDKRDIILVFKTGTPKQQPE